MKIGKYGYYKMRARDCSNVRFFLILTKLRGKERKQLLFDPLITDYSKIIIFHDSIRKEFIPLWCALSANLASGDYYAVSKIANRPVRDNIFPRNERRHLNQPPIGYRIPINPF